MTKLTKPMQDALSRLYRHHVLNDGFTDYGLIGLAANIRSLRALERRGLATEDSGAFFITDKGVAHCNAHERYYFSLWQENDSYNEDLQTAKQLVSKYQNDSDLLSLVLHWQAEANRLYNVSVDYTIPGGKIIDRKLYRIAQVYRYSSILARETYNSYGRN